ncbi:MAG: pyridoxamine 5'-phosphate oxidase family protein [Treponema sp.]|jgi:uncharacterized pyridoxamine 5'-phosphate oxidase family protein|nr:pyridoxamine 5'-phosphate oxidase family protein [Treponema sp.]
MNEVIKFLQDNKAFFLGTVDGDQPRVRPLSFVMVYEGKLSFCTNKQKPMSQQMKANPKVEISSVSPDGRTLRISGKVAFNTAKAAKEKALEIMPKLKGMYTADDDIFEIFYLESGVAVFSDMQGGKQEITL